jgi:hypothetical protein
MPDRQISSFDVWRFTPTVGTPLKVAVTVLLFAHLPHLVQWAILPLFYRHWFRMTNWLAMGMPEARKFLIARTMSWSLMFLLKSRSA